VTAAGSSPLNFSFDLAEDGWVALNWQSGSFTSATFTGPRGTESALSISSSGWRMPVTWLPAGHYQMSLTGGSGTVSFSLSMAPMHVRSRPNTAISVDMAASEQYVLYDVYLDAGQNYDFHGLAGASNGANWRLYDAAAVISRAATPLTRITAGSRSRAAATTCWPCQRGGSSGALRFEVAKVQPPKHPAGARRRQYGQHSVLSTTLNYSFSIDTASQLSLVQTLNSGNNSFSLYDIIRQQRQPGLFDDRKVLLFAGRRPVHAARECLLLA
jgi:hypothetical protein